MTSYGGGERASKSRTKVKPILRRLTQSEKNSLDLDRPATEQDGLGIYDYSIASRSSHDVAGGGGAFAPGGRHGRGYHNRSTSGTSQFSTATAGSGRNGSFVHPFQQTPRPYTPPLVHSGASYQTSLREYNPNSLDRADSPAALTEDEAVDLQLQLRPTFRSTSNLSNHRTPSATGTHTPTSPIAPPLRVQTKTSTTSRLALATSNSSLHNVNFDRECNVNSPIDHDTAMSPSSLRTSLDGFRRRTRSEASRGTETVEEARRKWHEREQLKDEKAAREEIKVLEKKQAKEAKMLERTHRRSSASEKRPTRTNRSRSDLTMGTQEKVGEEEGFVGREYASAPIQREPVPVRYLDGQHTDVLDGGQRRRSYTAKQKTHSAWTKFMMWLKTRFLRIKKKTKKTKETRPGVQQLGSGSSEGRR